MRCATGARRTSGSSPASSSTPSSTARTGWSTFFNGAVAREVLIDLDEDRRRLVWTIVDGPYSHHNGAAQVFAEDDGAARFVWTADLLPNEAAEVTDAMMERGVETVKRTLEGGADA